jgi:hypothetical protein
LPSSFSEIAFIPFALFWMWVLVLSVSLVRGRFAVGVTEP